VAPAVPAPAHTPERPPADDGLEATQRQAPVTPPPARRVNPADRPWLDVDGERYPLMGALTVLGRDDTADIILDDPGISRRHSEIRVTTDGPHLVASIKDLGSTNGTFVNSERITSQRLSDGDRITVGRTTVVYRAGRR
jgi:pSer/pThr/pTyr-binding forkhead associated (FHA) protein